MTVQELLARMSSRELSEWMAYARVEPFGEERADLRSGIVASILANVHRPKGRKPLKPEDFVITGDRAPRKRMSADEMLERVRVINKLMGGGEDLKKAKGKWPRSS